LILSIQNEDKPVGDKKIINKEDEQSLLKKTPRIEMDFENVCSVEVIIAQLQRLRHRMLYPYGTLADAC